MLGADLRRGRRRLSSSLQVPPWKPMDRARSPEPDNVSRPTTLPLRIPPRISITHADPDRHPKVLFQKLVTADIGGSSFTSI
ncbi:hypothetical protein lerEdw1_002211 [Lerista edwardsae]|nr:hypothetical protein lerEdw1_002211 [Lerista edwardsae]